MIRSVTVVNHRGESLRMELTSPQTSGFYIESIEGLGPVKANVNITERSTIDGGYFSSAHANTRNIVLNLGFWFDKDIESIRHESYRYFPLKQRISLIIETDKRTCETHGYVESNEPNIFSTRETTQISILCPDPYFYAHGGGGINTVIFSGIDSRFEFPFSNESLADKQMVISEHVDGTMRSVYNTGDVDVGATIHIRAAGAVTNPSVFNNTTGQSMRIDTARLSALTGSGIVEDDEIVISTVKGSKSVYLLRGGASINILNCLDRYTDWIRLNPGLNRFSYDADSGADQLEIRVENKIVYAGV